MKLQDQITDLKENHIQHIKVDLEILKTDVKWLKKLLVPVLIASVAGLIAQLFK